jgi:hypothetical protein
MSLNGKIDAAKQVGTLGNMGKKLNVMYCNPSITNADPLFSGVGQDILGPTGISYSELNINNYSKFGCDNVVLINQLYLDTIYNIKCILNDWASTSTVTSHSEGTTTIKQVNFAQHIFINGLVTINSTILQKNNVPTTIINYIKNKDVIEEENLNNDMGSFNITDENLKSSIFNQILSFIIISRRIISNSIAANTSVVIPDSYMSVLKNNFIDQLKNTDTLKNAFSLSYSFNNTNDSYNKEKGINFNCSFSADEIKHLQFAENKIQPDIILHIISISIMKSFTDPFLFNYALNM